MSASLAVVLATHNGAATLPEVLDAYTRLDAPDAQWEVVIVDNASTDGTPEICDAYASRLPLRRLDEPRRGKNRALNTALAEIHADLVVLTDDDAVPRPDWLRALERAAAAVPDIDIFGGRIRPRWPRTPPDWLLETIPLGPVYAITPDEWTSGPADAGRVWGPNMMVRARVLEAISFDPEVGPSAGQYVMGSESDFTRRAVAAGFRCGFCAEAIVEHLIRPAQMDRSWILRRAVRYGRAEYRLKRQRWQAGERPDPPFPPRLLRVLATRLLQGAWHRLRGRTSAWAAAMWEARRLEGQLRQAWQTRIHG